MKMKSLQELVLFFHEKWKIKVKKFHKREDKKLLIKKRYKEFSDFPFEKITPFEIFFIRKINRFDLYFLIITIWGR